MNFQPVFSDMDMKVSDSQYSFFNKLSAYNDVHVKDEESPTINYDQHKTFVTTTPTSHHDDIPSLEGLKRETALSHVGNEYYQMELSRDANSSPQEQTSCDDSSDPEIKEVFSIEEVMADTESLNLSNSSIPHRDKPDQTMLFLSNASLEQSDRLVSSEFMSPFYLDQPKIKDDSDYYVLPPATQVNSNENEVFNQDDLCKYLCGNEDPITEEDLLAIPLDIYQTVNVNQPKIKDDSGYILPPATEAHSNVDKVCNESELFDFCHPMCDDLSDNKNVITSEDLTSDMDQTVTTPQFMFQSNNSSSGYIHSDIYTA